MSSASDTSCPGARTTTAHGDSPHSSEGTPTTATSATAGWPVSMLSTSAGYTFSPPVTIMSVSRSCRVEVAVGVEGAAVAGAQPAAGEQYLGGRPGLAPVALHDARAGHQDLAALPGRPVLQSDGSTTRTRAPRMGRPAERRRCANSSAGTWSPGPSRVNPPVDSVRP